MPISKSAKKALRASKRKESVNKTVKTQVKSAIKKARQAPSEKLLSNVYSMLDRAAKKNVIHKNKANRLKKRISLLTKKNTAKA